MCMSVCFEQYNMLHIYNGTKWSEIARIGMHNWQACCFIYKVAL